MRRSVRFIIYTLHINYSNQEEESARYMAYVGERKIAYKMLARKHEGNK
jgi:hypothetical protein